jgi:hypothetical protein
VIGRLSAILDARAEPAQGIVGLRANISVPVSEGGHFALAIKRVALLLGSLVVLVVL